jgi:hypothetical protein
MKDERQQEEATEMEDIQRLFGSKQGKEGLDLYMQSLCAVLLTNIY